LGNNKKYILVVQFQIAYQFVGCIGKETLQATEESIAINLLPFYTNIDVIESPFQIRQFVDEVEHGDCNAFFRRLQPV